MFPPPEGGTPLIKLVKTALIATLIFGSAAATADIADLDWMTGSWAGPAGPDNTLEENWSAPADGSIGALVRMRGQGTTSMVELIVVEETDDGLVLHIQQWDPGFTPRPGGPQKMTMTAMGERTVSFKAVSDGGLTGLTYSRPADDTFTVDVETAEGGKFQLVLKAL
jgi:hypothetical protein